MSASEKSDRVEVLSSKKDGKRKKSFLDKLKDSRVHSFFIGLVLMFSFQNCEQFEALPQKTVGVSDNSGITTSSSSSSTPTPTPTNDPNAAAEAARKKRQAEIAECVTLISTPSIDSLSVSEVTVLSGLSNGAGDANSANINVTVTKGINNQARATQLACPLQTSLRVQQLNDDASHPHQIIHAVDLSGDQKVPANLTAYKAALNSLVSNSVLLSGNNQTVGPNSNVKAISFQPFRNNNNTNILRCVQGTAWFRVIARTEITGDGGAVKDSAPQVVKVNLVNNCWAESRLIPSNVLPRLVQYGAAADIKGNLAVVLAPKENSGTGTLEVGTAYVFEKQNENWVQSARFQVSDAFAKDTLNSVVIFNNMIVVGSRYRDKQGNVLVFGKSGATWQVLQKITPPVNQADQDFGAALAAAGTYLFIGAPNYNSSGAVSVYEWLNGNFIFRKNLFDQKGESYKGFGSALSADGTNLAVGAPQSVLHEPERAGEVQLFSLSNGAWNYAKTLAPVAADAVLGMKFGSSVAMKNGKILVGASAFATSDTDLDRGAAFYYSSSAAAAVKMTGSGGGERFGHSVAISDTGILIGAPYKTSRQGLVNYSTFSDAAAKKVTRIHYSQVLAAQDNFGDFIAVSGSDILVGARAKSSPNAGAGAAYIYVLK